MTKEEKRQLLIDFFTNLNSMRMIKNMYLTPDEIVDKFLSTLPDEGEKVFTKCLDCPFTACENHKKCLRDKAI